MITQVETSLVYEAGVEDYGTQGSKALVFGNVKVVMQSPEDCDEVIKAAAKAKRQMLGAQPSWCTAETDLDGETLYCDRDPGHDGSHHAPGLDEGSEIAWSDSCDERWPGGLGFVCTLYAGHAGPHEAWGTDEDEPLQVWVTPRDLEDGA